MFILKFLNSLPQPPKDNPWPTNSISKKFRTQCHCQCNYLVGFQASRKINDSILEKRWPINNTDAKDDPYQNTCTCLQQGNGPANGGQHN